MPQYATLKGMRAAPWAEGAAARAKAGELAGYHCNSLRTPSDCSCDF